MIKIIISLTKIVITAMIALLFTSCQYNFDFGAGIKGTGNVTTQQRNSTTEFSSIDASRGLEVEVEQSNSRAITVVADKNLLDHITTEVSNGILKITSDENIKRAESKKIIVQMPVIKGLKTSSGASLTSKNILKSDALQVQSSSGSEIKIVVEAEHLICNSSSGSSIILNGKALKLETTSSSGSEIDAQKLLSNQVKAQASSGSSTQVNSLVSLTAKASSGSSIDYQGNPKTIAKEVSSGASVSAE